MVVGLDKFKEYFGEHVDQYVLIGGSACDILCSRAGIDFRATKDLDLVLCVEAVKPDLAKQFDAFLGAGGYEVWSNSEGEKKFFRFEKPKDKAFPFMLELFARPPAALDLPPSDRYVRMPVDDSVLSLSALLLDDAYYNALKSGQTVVDGVSVLNENLLIPFKAKAFLDLSEREAKGDKSVKGDDIKKHRKDVFRMLRLFTAETKVKLPDAITVDLRRFVDAVEADKKFNSQDFGMEMSTADAIALLRSAFQL